MFRLALPVIVALAPALSAAAAEAKVDDRRRPFARHAAAASLGLAAGFPEDLTMLTVGLGGRYFAMTGLAVALDVSNTFLVWSSTVEAGLDDVASQVPTNAVQLTPGLQYVLWRSRWFSPYVHGGAGPVFLNHDGGTLGAWLARPGAFIGVGGRVFVDVGVRFWGAFPGTTCDEAFVHAGSDPPRTTAVEGYCGFQWGPELGVLVAF